MGEMHLHFRIAVLILCFQFQAVDQQLVGFVIQAKRQIRRKRPRARSAAVFDRRSGPATRQRSSLLRLAFIRNHCLHLCCTISRLIITDHKCCFFQGKGQYGGNKKAGERPPATTTLQNYSALNQSSALSQVSWSISSIRSLSVLAPPITERPLAPA
ncbi:Uncharacterised protein [Serratia fonticola]|uniref:Uncharacterized protein n=1 Tax=Serratia fonticola TaxID=47917 RepID=A0A4U9VJZ9_SERFO|nr:Uncharacterised protein [Serratia fonticola]